MNNTSEFDNMFEEYLHYTVFGSIFGESWAGAKAPRAIFYSFMVIACLMCLSVNSILMLIIPTWIVVILCSIYLSLFVLYLLLPYHIQSKSLDLLEFIALPMLFVMLGLATVIFNIYEHFHR